MTDTLRERVAEAMWMADVEPYDPSDRIPFKEAPESARAYVYAEADAAIALIRNEVLEEAARVAEGFPARTHGNLSADPYAAAEQAAGEIAAAIRALKDAS